MVNPGAFQGLRKEFLTAQKEAYATAHSSGTLKDTVADIQRRFFKRFPVSLPADQEPTAEHMSSVNDFDPDPEPEEPDKEKLSEEEYAAELAKLNERKKSIASRKDVRGTLFVLSVMCPDSIFSKSNVGWLTNTRKITQATHVNPTPPIHIPSSYVS
jgi:hypothetical protein